MLEYFTYKKVKKHQAEKRVEEGKQTPLISEEDEHFLQRVVSAEGTPPPLPDRPLGWASEAGDSTNNAAQMVVHDGNGTAHDTPREKRKDKGKGIDNSRPGDKDAKGGRFAFLQRTFTKKGKKSPNLSPDSNVVTPNEAASEEDDINRILEDLNLSAINNRAFSLSKESQVLVQKFTVILKDLMNGVPTAYDDLVHLLDDSQGTLAKSYDHLPSFLQKLVTQLPDKLTKNLAPELLAVATEAQAFGTAGSSGSGAAAAGGAATFGAAAKNFLKPTSLKDLVTKPGAVVTMLKTIMNALKLRWPAFMGTNVLLSLGLFVLLFVFWYCHKRGRETRLEREARVDSDGRIIELDDDAMLGEGSQQDGPQGYHERRREREHEQDLERERERDHDRRPASSKRKSHQSSRRSSRGREDRERERRSHERR